MRERGPVHALRAQHVHVVLLDVLLRREGLGGAEEHVAGILHDDVEPSGIRQDLGDARLDRCVRLDVQLDAAQVDALFGGPGRDLGDAPGVAARRLAHRGVDGVAGRRQRAGGHQAEAGRGAGDEDDGVGLVGFLCRVGIGSG
jgi:hypothetical protein